MDMWVRWVRKVRLVRWVRWALLIGLLMSSPAPHAQAPKRLALVGGMLLTGYDVPPIHHAAVLVEGNTIVQAGPASEVKIPADATVVDTSGRTMLPGLIETHGHLIVLGHGNYGTWFTWINSHGGRQMLMKVMETSAKQLLMAGVTTEVDLGAPLADSLAIRDRIRKGEAVGPRVFVSGPWIAHLSAAAAGDAMQVGFGAINTSTPAEAAQQAERLAAAGVDHIKAHTGLGFEDYKAIVAVARFSLWNATSALRSISEISSPPTTRNVSPSRKSAARLTLPASPQSRSSC